MNDAIPTDNTPELDHQTGLLSQNLLYYNENIARLMRVNHRLTGTINEPKDLDKEQPVPEGRLNVLMSLNKEFERLNTKTRDELDKLDKSI